MKAKKINEIRQSKKGDCGKREFSSKAKADRFIRIMKRLNNNGKFRARRSYERAKCNKWHLTSQR